MTVTVMQARGMSCPLIIGRGEDFTCGADRCPMWRWAESAEAYEVIVPASESPTGEPELRRVPRENRGGYCGLAGEPRFGS
jgi:hypothetical protein